MTKLEYPLICELLGYFHEDWPLFDADMEAVVESFKADYPNQVRGIMEDIDRILQLKITDEDLLRFITLECACALNPTVGYGSSRNWLLLLKSLLADGVRFAGE
jgi:hypothetical protein